MRMAGVGAHYVELGRLPHGRYRWEGWLGAFGVMGGRAESLAVCGWLLDLQGGNLAL